MANDPLPLPDVSAEPPPDNVHGADHLHGADDAHGGHDAQAAEYEAIHAEIAATERGRWFLNEHVKQRNRAADTDRLVGSLACAEAAMRGDGARQIAGAPADDLVKLAAAVGQVEAVMAASVPPAAAGLTASGRIQDVALALRERGTDAALCDALESALFELRDALAQHDAAAERTRSAAVLLRGVRVSLSALFTVAAASLGGGAASIEADSPAPVESGLDESWAVEPAPSGSVIGEPAMIEPLEPPARESEPAARAGSITPSMWDTAAAPDAKAMANGLGAPRASDLGDAAAPADQVNDPRASTEIVCGSASGEKAVTDDALPPALGEAAVVDEPLPDAGLAREEAQSSAPGVEQPSEQSTIEPSVTVLATAEALEPAVAFHAEPPGFTAEVPANDENTGRLDPAEDGGGPSAIDALETTWSADDEIESLLDAEPAELRSRTTQPAGAQEDLDDLFEPLPPEPDTQRAAVNAAQSGPRQQMLSPALPALAFSGSAMRIGASPAEPPLLLAAAPAARTISRPAPNDPLAAVRALSEEELIALFS